MSRLNSGIKNHYNFFILANFVYPIIRNDTVDNAEFETIKSPTHGFAYVKA